MTKDLPQTADALVESVYEFNRIGSMPPPGNFEANRVGFYIGMVFEELAETIKEVATGAVSQFDRGQLTILGGMLDNWGEAFKADNFHGAILRADREKLLDGTIDMVVVALGATMFQTPKFRDAISAVLAANMAKFPNGVATRNDQGKVVKPEGWAPPNLAPFVDHYGE